MKKNVFFLGMLAVILGLGFILAGGYKAAATDAPHNLENELKQSSGCTQTCHTLHGAVGESLNSVLGNVNLCVSCHKSTSPANTFVLPGTNITAAGVVGIHHQYNVPWANAGTGSQSPATLFPGKKVLEGANIICSSCHDVHVVGSNYGSQKVSQQPGVAAQRIGGGGGGTVTLNTVPVNASAKAYLIEMVTGGALGAATYKLSNDGGVSWWGWNSSAWVIYSGADARTTGAGQALNDSVATVTVTFAGTFAAADKWQFYISYPFLRGPLDSGDNSTGTNFCRHCHANRVNTYSEVRGPGDGAKKFNHPVGAALNANGKGYDSYDSANSRYAPRNSTGTYQEAAPDTNPSNKLRLAADGTVQCYSCHNVHFGDSNSQTQDSPMQW